MLSWVSCSCSSSDPLSREYRLSCAWNLPETDKNALLRRNSATVIIVPRSAGVSAPGIPTAFIKAAIAAQGKSLAYKDSLAFPTRKST